MARATGKAILDQEVQPTHRVGQGQVQEALDMLQVRGVDAQQIAASPLGPILVALVKHMARNGLYMAVSLDDPSGVFEDAAASGRPRRLPGR